MTSSRPARVRIEEMRLERDYPGIAALFEREEWPFLRSDLEISHAQPGAAAFVALQDGTLGGFFATHAFGEIGYLDMMIVAPEFRKLGVTRQLYSRTMQELKRKGIRSFVVHTTNDSSPLIRFLGFRPGQTFTLLRREPLPGAKENLDTLALGPEHQREVAALDTLVFGMDRPSWIGGLLRQQGPRFFGLRRGTELAASLCLRPRRGEAYCLDLANARSFPDLAELVTRVVRGHAAHRLECFVLTGSELHALLQREGFSVPDFFKAIGPLVEWRRGPVGNVGTSPQVQCLAWF